MSKAMSRFGGFGCTVRVQVRTHRPLSSSFLGLSYRIFNISHKTELLRGLWVIIIYSSEYKPTKLPSVTQVHDY